MGIADMHLDAISRSPTAYYHGTVLMLASCMLIGCDRRKEFWAAIARNDASAVTAMVRSSPYLAKSVDEYGDTGLNRAAEKGNLEMVNALIAADGDVNYDGGRIGVALHYAAYFGDTPIVQALLRGGAQVNMQASKGRASYGTALHHAALGAQPEVVRLLLQHGADVNASEERFGHGTPLHEAVSPEPARAGRHEVVSLLLAHGADVNSKARLGHTPVFWAQQWSSPPEIMDLLTKYGGRSE